MKPVIKFCPENDIPQFVDVYLSQKTSAFIQDGNVIIPAGTERMDELPHLHIRANRCEVTVDDFVHTHQGKNGLVCMMRKKFPLFCQTDSIYTVMLEDINSKVGTDGHDDQWNEKLISPRQFGNEEDASQRCMHDGSHDGGHAIKREVLLRNINP